MPTWITHFMVSDAIMQRYPKLKHHEFSVGSIAPDCNLENEDWSAFIPPRKVTHFMQSKKKTLADADRFYETYATKRFGFSPEFDSFLLGYYCHLVVDATFQIWMRDPARVREIWLRFRARGFDPKDYGVFREDFDSLKMIVKKNDRLSDIHWIESEYLEKNPNSRYFTEIYPLVDFPDYLDFLPKGAIPRKVRVMRYLPKKCETKWSWISLTREEYNSFLSECIKIVTDKIDSFYQERAT